MTHDLSALFAGSVVHTRFTPRRHRLGYRMFQILLDLEDAPRLGRRLRLFSYNTFNLFSFHDSDHGDGVRPLRRWVEEALAQAGVDIADGSVQILCLPRVLGHVFNPLSVYFCRSADGGIAAIIYEVNNTFGQRHSYVIPALGAHGRIVQTCAKAFHVSPFMDMDMTYAFRISPPSDRVVTTVEGRNLAGETVILATFQGRRRALTDAGLLRAFREFPLLTLKVVAAIHLEAAKLIAKGLRLRPAPSPPAHPISVGAVVPTAEKAMA